MDKIKILWADDEIDLLKPHILFLENKGYELLTSTNGADALDIFIASDVDIVFLDENMPGLSGLETLSKMKSLKPAIPIVMITKSEEESIMNDAIGSKISDYLIKPVNPNQILLSIKKNLDTRRLVSEKTTSDYRQEFAKISMRLNDRLDSNEWAEVYKNMIYWELELQGSGDEGMAEILNMQKSEANNLFCRFIANNYTNWLQGKSNDTPLMSHTIFKKEIIPFAEKNDDCVFLIVIDNLRYDQWKVIEPIIGQYFKKEKEQIYYSILPTATAYSRNAIFSGLLPSEMEKRFPQYWSNDEDDGGKNLHEANYLEAQLKLLGRNYKHSYTKITNLNGGKKCVDLIPNMLTNKLNVIIYNFVDMLSHAKTEMEVIKELADNDAAYRSLTKSWFEHSPLLDIIKLIAEKNARLILTTDHGTIQVREPSKIVGDRNTNTNLRYKQGKNLQYDKRDVFEIRNPQEAYLPRLHPSSAYVFAKEAKYFVYPNNYNHFVNYYQNTYQHGGISLEEMLIPLVSLTPR